MTTQGIPPGVSPVAPPPAGRGAARQGSGCLLALVILLMIGLALSVVLNVALLGGRGAGRLASGPEPLREKWVAGEGEAKVCLIELDGIILDEVRSDGLIGAVDRPVERIGRELEAAARDDGVKAILFAVDSPGGSVSASDGIWHKLDEFKRKAKKPVVVWMGGLCASGGYYVSMPGDVVFASPTTITGSIGVITSGFNLSGLLTKFDVQPLTIKAGANKDLLNPFHPIKEEHVQIIQGVIDSAYDLFVKRVADGRKRAGLAEAQVRVLADGRIYTAEQALKEKLVDKIGYRDDAFEEARTIAGVKEATLFRYTHQPGLLEILSGGDASAAAATRMPGLAGIAGSPAALMAGAGPRPFFLWAPSLAAR